MWVFSPISGVRAMRNNFEIVKSAVGLGPSPAAGHGSKRALAPPSVPQDGGLCKLRECPWPEHAEGLCLPHLRVSYCPWPLERKWTKNLNSFVLWGEA